MVVVLVEVVVAVVGDGESLLFFKPSPIAKPRMVAIVNTDAVTPNMIYFCFLVN